MSKTISEPTPLTVLSPIRNGVEENQSFASLTRKHLQSLKLHENSPMAKVPNTFLCRFFILDDVIFEGSPAKIDHLKSKYLVFCCNFHGNSDTYLRGFWQNAKKEIQEIWKYCVAFDQVNDADSFIDYIKKCEVNTTIYFNGSTGLPLDEQLKALYLKQKFSEFAYQTQGFSAEKLFSAFQKFVSDKRPTDLSGPTWRPGQDKLPIEEKGNPYA